MKTQNFKEHLFNYTFHGLMTRQLMWFGSELITHLFILSLTSPGEIVKLQFFNISCFYKFIVPINETFKLTPLLNN